MGAPSTFSPGVPQGIPMTPPGSAQLTGPWYTFFTLLWQRTGGSSGTASSLLDTIADTLGTILYRASGGWAGLAPGARYRVLRMGLGDIPEWDQIDGNSFASQPADQIFAAPVGGAGNPGFRLLATTDLDGLAGQYPGTTANDSAATGNIGEYFDASAGPVALTTATPADVVSLPLPDGDFDVWGNLVITPAASTTISNIQGWLNHLSATDPGPPNGGAYTQFQRAVAAGNLSVLPIGMMRVVGGQTIYLSANISFAISTLSASAFLGARRRR